MGRVYLCLGKQAEVPYYFERARIHVWNVEELCYFVRENAWVLEPSLLGRELAEWVGKQCALEELSAKLAAAQREEDPVIAFVRTLFSYTGYCPVQEAEQIEKILGINEKASELERAAARGDYYLQSGKYVMALREYEELLEGLTGMDPAFLGRIYHNCGVARARLFLFGEAAEAFEKAWRLTRDRESAAQYLIALRMSLGEQGYVNFVAERPDLYAESLQLEERIKSCDAAWEASEACAFLQKVMQTGEEGEAGLGRRMAGEKIEELHRAYRACVES